jgi:hypothetical protein
MTHEYPAPRATADRQSSAIAEAEPGAGDEGADIQALLTWLQRNQVVLGGLVLIAAQLAWKAHVLGHLFFTQDDYYNLDLAIQSPFTWHYLTFVGVGHLMVGERAIAWLLARVSLYDWSLASGVLLALQACASLAALRLLRTLFGNRPVILIPLAVYVLTPLTIADLGWLSAALESVPLQLAIFMAVNAHVCYIRSGRARHLVAAAFWVTFGLAFFEKALVLPLLLFAITAAFFASDTSLLVGVWRALRRYWRAWLVYAALMASYAVLLAVSLRTSASQQQPASIDAALRFAWSLVKQVLIPGAVGGPWKWYPIFGGSYSLAAPPAMLIWLAAGVTALVVGLSISRRRFAWRAWAILAGWVALADILPLVIGGRISGPILGIRALETHYLADAAPVLAIAVGLALLPLRGGREDLPEAPTAGKYRSAADHAWRLVAPVLVGVFVLGSIWSVQAYENVTTGLPAARYIANAQKALRLVPRGAPVLSTVGPTSMVNWGFGKYQYTSTLIGDMARGKLANKVRWISHPDGTIDGLLLFGSDGRLYPAMIFGASSVPRTAQQGCWPERNGRIVVSFTAPSSVDAWELRVGYIWYPTYPWQIAVHYGTTVRNITVSHGLHSAYVPVAGRSVSRITIDGLGSNAMCVGDAEAGTFVQRQAGPAIPPVSQ